MFGFAVEPGYFDIDDGDEATRYLDLAIGAPYQSFQNYELVGRVYIMRTDPATITDPDCSNWTFPYYKTLRRHDNLDQTYQRFGASLAAGSFMNEPDSDRAGYSSLVVGAPGASIVAGQGEGEVNIFWADNIDTLENSTYHYATLETNGNPQPFQQYGFSVDSGYFNDDNYEDIVIGAPDYDESSSVDAGRVCVLVTDGQTGDPTLFQQECYQSFDGIDKWAGAQANERRGFSVLTANFDVDMDGLEDVAVGAPGARVYNEDQAQWYTGSGKAYILFSKFIPIDEGNHPYAHYDFREYTLNYPDDDNAAFGTSLALGDFQDNGVFDLIVGAPRTREGNHLLAGRIQFTKSPGGGAADWFGDYVYIPENIDFQITQGGASDLNVEVEDNDMEFLLEIDAFPGSLDIEIENDAQLLPGGDYPFSLDPNNSNVAQMPLWIYCENQDECSDPDDYGIFFEEPPECACADLYPTDSNHAVDTLSYCGGGFTSTLQTVTHKA